MGEWGMLNMRIHWSSLNIFVMPQGILHHIYIIYFLTLREETFFGNPLSQNIPGGLDEVGRFCDEFSLFCQDGNSLEISVTI